MIHKMFMIYKSTYYSDLAAYTTY